MDLDDADELRDAARIWLVRAAEVARSAAAGVEAREHMIAALEFARPQDYPELHELLGDVEIGGGPIVAAYSKALDLAREADRPESMQLRLLAKQLMVEMRSQGSVGSRRSDEQLNALRREGRRLLETTNDQSARALFLAADAFYPFWVRASRRYRSVAEADAARASASEALELARGLGDANMESVALDALGALAVDEGDWQTTVALGRERIAMGSRLVLFERIDAYSVVAWAGALSGDLKMAEDVTNEGLAVIQPGQAPDWTLHLLAWRAVALMLFGKWDATLASTDQAVRVWSEAGRPAAGYAMRGFIAGLVVARARRDETRMHTLRSVIRQIGESFVPRRFTEALALIDEDIPGVAAALERGEGGLGARGSYEEQAMVLSTCTDVLQSIDGKLLLGALEQSLPC